MGFFKAKKAKGVKKPGDSVGGYQPIPSDIYTLTVTGAYGVDSTKSDAQAVRLEVKIKELDRKLTATHWFSGADGQVTSTYNDKVSYKKGYLILDALALLATEGEFGLTDLETEPKVIKVKRDGKEVNETVDSFPELIGFTFKAGLIDSLAYKQNQVDGVYVDTEEVVHDTQWHTIFDEDGFTLTELENEAEEPEFQAKWLEAWKGKTRDLPKKREDTGSKGKRSSNADSSPASRKAARRSAIRGK